MLNIPSPDKQDRIKESHARRIAGSVLGDVIDGWPAEDVFEYLEADGYEWVASEGFWATAPFAAMSAKRDPLYQAMQPTGDLATMIAEDRARSQA